MQFEILGPLRARVGDADVPVTAARERALLATLLLQLDRHVPTGVLVNAIWGEQPPAQAHNQVQHCVSQLRRLHANAGYAGEVIVTEPGGYRLNADGIDVDLQEFRRLVASARTATNADLPKARDQYRAAMALWRGRALVDIDSSSVQLSAVALEEERVQAIEECLQVELTLGRAGELVAELRELVGAHPYREGLHHALILALFRAGRRADALTAYRDVRSLLVTELGLEPGTALRELHKRILADDVTLLAGEPARGGVPTPLPKPRQLPAPPQLFTGRATELAELERLPDSAETVVVVAIDGMAGVGKTALAIHAGHRVAGRYPDGQLFVDLNGHTQDLPPLDPGDALDRLLRALGTPGEQIPAELDGRAGMYRSRLAGQRILLLLDNAATEAQVAPLLPGTPGCLVIVTSRRRLTALEDTHTVSLAPIPQADAVALFTRIVGPSRLRDQRPELVEEIIEQCGRLPLAIRIAASRLKSHHTWSMTDLVERLRDHQRRLGELETGQRSVTAALDLSYQQLPAEQQRAYRLLGLHPGPDTDAQATAALCHTTVAQARRLLDQLHEAHLLQEPIPGRYRFHDLIRSHAAVKAEAEPDQGAALTRLFDGYLRTAEAAMRIAYPHERERSPGIRLGDPPACHPVDPTGATAWLDIELPNLLAVAQHAAGHGWPDHTTQLSTTLQGYLLVRGRYRDAEWLHNRALELARATGNHAGEMAALIGLGHTHRRQGRAEQAAGYLTQACEIARATGNHHYELSALIGLGRGFRLQARYEAAVDYLTQAREIARTTGNRYHELDALIGLGHTYRQQGKYQPAVDYLTQAREIARATGNLCGELGTLTGLGRVHLMQGRLAEAADELSRALEVARTTGDRTIELSALTGLSHIRRLQGHCEQAMDNCRQALGIAREIGSRNWQFESVQGLGRAHHKTGRASAAVVCHQQALQIAADLGQPEDQARAHNGLAHAHLALDQVTLARRHWAAALEILTYLGNSHTEDGEATVPGIRARLADLDRRAAGDGSTDGSSQRRQARASELARWQDTDLSGGASAAHRSISAG